MEAALPKQQSLVAIGFHGPLFFEFNKFYSLFEITNRFFLVNLVGNVKML